jgi:hypothetical protein
MFSCKTWGFCPSCQAKRVEIWGEWARDRLLLDVPHRQVVFTIPKMLRVFFKFKRRLLGDLSRAALRALSRYFEAAAGEPLIPGVIALMNRSRFMRTDRNGRGYSDVNVHSLVRTGTKAEAERVGKDMIRPVVSLERLAFLESEGQGARLPLSGMLLGEKDAYPDLYAKVFGRPPRRLPPKIGK